METYAETGLIRYEYKHFAFLGEESFNAAEASECANEQGMFWPYHDILFLNQSGENQGAFSDDNLRVFAEALDLDLEAYDACYESGRYTDTVIEEGVQAAELGVASTPSFRINGELIEGLRNFEQFQSIIQAILSDSQ